MYFTADQAYVFLYKQTDPYVRLYRKEGHLEDLIGIFLFKNPFNISRPKEKQTKGMMDDVISEIEEYMNDDWKSFRLPNL
ncbi:hypothetical protein ABIE66_004871 [Peribacillus sp. B2I2]|uniref:hypothetical protein n=1 Tax=Peribacillus sp. B2I2 TaxID=3156468 RepID=UPI003519B9E2